MSKSAIFLRLLLVLIVGVPLGIVIYQNAAFFFAPVTLTVDLHQLSPNSYSTTQLNNLFYWLMCILGGLLIGASYGWAVQYRLKRQLKQAQTALDEARRQLLIYDVKSDDKVEQTMIADDEEDYTTALNPKDAGLAATIADKPAP